MLKSILRFWWLVLAFLLCIFGADFWHFNVMEAFATFAIIVGAIIAFAGWCMNRQNKKKRKRLREQLCTLSTRGQWIKARLISKDEKTYDKHSNMISDWVQSVMDTLISPTDKHTFQSDSGLEDPEDIKGETGLAQFNIVDRNYIFKRLARLEEIIDRLRDQAFIFKVVRLYEFE